jgi:putative intracellular protease/amidase
MTSSSTTRNRNAHVAIYDAMADWEVGHLLAELRTGRFTTEPWSVVSVATAMDPITTMGGVRLVPDMVLVDLDPSASDLLILPGGEAWDRGEGGHFVEAAKRFLDQGVAVAAICGATFGLAGAGLLDARTHTSAALDYLRAAHGYDGAERYVEARASVGGGLITAGPTSPVQFSRATLEHLGLISPEIGEAYEAVFDREDAAAYPVLMGAHG